MIAKERTYAPAPPDPPRSALGRLNPMTQLALAGVLSLAALAFPWYVGLAVTAICFVLATVLGKLGSFWSVWWKTVLILVIIILVLQTFFIGGESVLYTLGPISATQEGLDRGVGFACRVLGMGSSILLLTQMLDIHKLVQEMEQRGYHPKLTYVILATVSIIPEMGKRMSAIMAAQRSRGIETDSNVWVRAKAFVPTIGPLILTSIVSVEEKALTLESRGFSIEGKRTSLHHVEDPPREKAARRLLGIMALLIVIGGILLWVL